MQRHYNRLPHPSLVAAAVSSHVNKLCCDQSPRQTRTPRFEAWTDGRRVYGALAPREARGFGFGFSCAVVTGRHLDWRAKRSWKGSARGASLAGDCEE